MRSAFTDPRPPRPLPLLAEFMARGWLPLRDAGGSLGRSRVTIRVGSDRGSAARGGIGRSGTVERSTTARSVDHVVTAAGSRCERRGSESLDPCPGAVGTELARAHPRYRASLALSVPEPILVLNEPGTPDESGVCIVRDTVRSRVMLGMREDSAKRLQRRQRGALRLPQGSWCRAGPGFMRKTHPESMRPVSHCDTGPY